MLKKIFNRSHSWLINSDSQTGAHKASNEDHVVVKQTPALAILCDGVGGNACGEVASHMASHLLADQLAALSSATRTPESIKTLIKSAHCELLEHMQTHPETQGMATTMVMIIQSDRQAWLAWVGDSRAYLIRDNTLQQLTEDHSFVNEKVAQGIFTPEEADQHPMANLITSSLGGSINSLKKIGCAKIKLKKNDQLVLCSDGVYSYMTDDQLLTTGQQSAQALTTLAIANDTQDNCSAVCIEIQ